MNSYFLISDFPNTSLKLTNLSDLINCCYQELFLDLGYKKELSCVNHLQKTKILKNTWSFIHIIFPYIRWIWKYMVSRICIHMQKQNFLYRFLNVYLNENFMFFAVYISVLILYMEIYWPDISCIKQLLDKAMANIKTYSVETSDIRQWLAQVAYCLAKLNKFDICHHRVESLF